METKKIGEYAFLAGIAIAVLAGLVSGVTPTAIAAYAAPISMLLVVLGIVVGLLNISEKETTAFLVAAIALVTAGTASFAAIDIAGVGADGENRPRCNRCLCRSRCRQDRQTQEEPSRSIGFHQETSSERVSPMTR